MIDNRELGAWFMNNEQYTSLVEAIYTAAADPGHWQFVAEGILDVVGGHGVNLVFENRSDHRLNVAYSNIVDQDKARYYKDNFLVNDDLVATFLNVDSEDCFLSQDIFPNNELYKFPVMEGFYDHFDYHLFNSMLIYREDGDVGWLSIVRSRKDKPFSPEQKQIMQRLAPHVRRAVLVNKQLVAAQSQSILAAGLFDRLSMAVLLIDKRGQVCVRNRRAENLYRRGVLVMNCGSLRVCDHAVNKQLLSQLKDLGKGPAFQTVSENNIFSFFDNQGEQYFVSVLPYNPSEQQAVFFGDEISSLVLITEKANTATLPVDVLCQAYAISQAESRVLQLLIQDMKSSDIADCLSVSCETVRFHLKNLYKKTDTRTRAELLGLVMRTLGRLEFSKSLDG
jgi:DNA-binding CsgD family transcriptional regulator